ncbi:MAG: hypothetical protein IPL83_06705 [Bdellovibrionales bacterium]|nr:hypothetical protein [Bdellovibrionales bacterium]
MSFLFSCISSWLSPKFLSWYASPPVPIGVSCDGAITWVMSKLILAQSISSLLGGIVGLTIYLWIRSKSKKAQAVSPHEVSNLENQSKTSF